MNGEDRLIVLNKVAKSVIEGKRGLDSTWVFPSGKLFEGKARPLYRMNDTAWRNARDHAARKWAQKHKCAVHSGFARLRVHDLKHIFDRRPRVAEVPEEDRKAILGHADGRITSHHSAAELRKLIEYVNRVTPTDERSPALTVLKRRIIQ